MPSESTAEVQISLNDLQRQAIVALINKTVVQKFTYLLDGLEENIVDALFEELATLDEEVAKTRHFNVMRCLRTGREAYRERFQKLIVGQVKQIVDCDPMLEPESDDRAQDIIRQFERKSSIHYKVLISDTRKRLSLVAGRELERFPLTPVTVFAMFWQATAVLELPEDERVVLLPLFHRFVMDRYGQVLAAINRVLSEQGIPECVS